VNNDVAGGSLADSYSYKLIDMSGLVVYHDDEPPRDRFFPVQVWREWSIQSSIWLGGEAWWA
jgi:hypothetical protein